MNDVRFRVVDLSDDVPRIRAEIVVTERTPAPMIASLKSNRTLTSTPLKVVNFQCEAVTDYII